MYILSDIAHMLKIHQVSKETVLATCGPLFFLAQPCTRPLLQDTLDTLAHCELEEHVPVKLTTSHPLVEDGGDTVWNVGTSVDPEGRGGYSYSVVRFRRDRPGVTGTMMIEDAQVRHISEGHSFV